MAVFLSSLSSGAYSCGAELRLPPNYRANLTIGEDHGEEATNNMPPYAQYMQNNPAPHASAGISVSFQSFRDVQLNMYWDNGSFPGSMSGYVRPRGQVTEGTTTYPSHAFRLIDPAAPDVEVARVVIQEGVVMYIIDAEPERAAEVHASATYIDALARV